jgi:glycosyltransferase involved in cell wall biosynthesis
MVTSVLSYWRDYFDPDGPAARENHSTGLIAAGLHRLLSGLGPVAYYDHAEQPRQTDADLFVGHFWSFAGMCRANTFRRRIAVYVLSDPVAARGLLAAAAADHGVPMCDWDLPPASFDHEETMSLADLILVCGNRHTLATFPSRWQSKLRVFNYALDPDLWTDVATDPEPGSAQDFVYVATHCGLRKGFLDVIATWADIPPDRARLHVIGRVEPPFDALLADVNPGSVVVHGWVDSRSARYRALLAACRYAYVPTWVEGQMGTLLEAIFAGCLPITTAACGIDDEVLRHCLLVDPMRPDQHRNAIETALAWTPETYLTNRAALLAAARRRHNWACFDLQVGRAIDEVLTTGAGEPADDKPVAGEPVAGEPATSGTGDGG